MNEINDWERRREERVARESAELTDKAFERFDKALKKATKHAIIKTEDPLFHPGVSLRDFHVRWAIRLQVMACDALVADLAEADMVGAGL